jgi:hypothetical protein
MFGTRMPSPEQRNLSALDDRDACRAIVVARNKAVLAMVRSRHCMSRRCR